LCRERGIAHRRCGKLIVASAPERVAELATLRTRALGNGVELTPLDAAAARALEPQLECAAALLSPETGIVDAQALMLALLAEAEAHGATLACRSAVSGLGHVDGAFRIAVNGEAYGLEAHTLVNSAGLDAPAVARLLEGAAAAGIPQAWPCKGSYFTLAGATPFTRLIYPLPERDALGVHLTLDLAGRARFGPDVEWVTERNYAVETSRAAAFYGAVRAWWPELPEGALQPAYAGIRPRIYGPGEPVPDFRIEGPPTHGVRSLVNLFGIESPGLTASLAIAAHVATLLG
jgi:L-2-hydroxyglutarate oxidase LhgO